MAIDKILPDESDPFQPGPARGFLVGRTALVTGGARRIGRYLSLALAGQGADIVLHYRKSILEAQETAAAIRERGGECWLVEGDLADAGVAADLVSLAAAACGREIDILINNASVFSPSEAISATAHDWDLNQAVNLRAPFLLAQSMARQLPIDRPGDIVNLNDVRALKPGTDHFAYTISKVGMHGLTRSLALALAPSVRVNELALGAILPPDKPGADYLHETIDDIPTRRFDSPEEVTGALLFVLGNQALTGATICIDGGRHLV